MKTNPNTTRYLPNWSLLLGASLDLGDWILDLNPPFYA